MVETRPHAVLSWEAESTEAHAHFNSIPWIFLLLCTPTVRCVRCAYRYRLSPGWDPVVNGILRGAKPAPSSEMSASRGILHYMSAIAEPRTFTTLSPVINEDIPERAGTDGFYAALTQQVQPGSKLLGEFPQHLDFYNLTSSLNGLPSTLHGGITTLLIDSAFAKLGMMHATPLLNPYEGSEGQFYSAYTNVTYLRPIVMNKDGTVNFVVRAQIDGTRTKEGDRKIYVLAHVVGEGDVVYARGDGLLIERTWDGRDAKGKL